MDLGNLGRINSLYPNVNFSKNEDIENKDKKNQPPQNINKNNPSHPKQQRPPWIPLPTEVQRKIFDQSDLVSVCAYMQTNTTNYSQGGAYLRSLFADLEAHAMELANTQKKWTEKDLGKLQSMAQSIVNFDKTLKNAPADPSSDLRKAEKIWVDHTGKSVKEAAELAKQVDNKAMELGVELKMRKVVEMPLNELYAQQMSKMTGMNSPPPPPSPDEIAKMLQNLNFRNRQS